MVDQTNQSVSGGQVPGQAVAPQTQQTVAPVVPAEQGTAPTIPSEGSFPADISQRTSEQFDKLKDSNNRLYEANKILRDELTRKAMVEQQFAPVQQVQQTQQPNIADFITNDPVTGEQFVDNSKLQKVIAETNQRATKAEVAVQSYIKQQQYMEEQKQTEEAYKNFPQLNPSVPDKFDTELSKRTRTLLLDSMMNPVDYGGRPLSFREAAELANGDLSKIRPMKQTSQAPEQASAKTQQQEDSVAKEQAGLAAQGTSSASQPPAVSPDEDLTNLRLLSRKGGKVGDWAIAQRLSKIPHTGIPKSSAEA